jgi:hypothetical protein
VFPVLCRMTGTFLAVDGCVKVGKSMKLGDGNRAASVGLYTTAALGLATHMIRIRITHESKRERLDIWCILSVRDKVIVRGLHTA